MSFKIGQFSSGNDLCLIFIENGFVYRFNEGAPKTTLELLKGCIGANALSKKIQEHNSKTCKNLTKYQHYL